MCIGLLPASWCVGGDLEVGDANEPTFFLGLGGIVTSKPYIGVDAKAYPVPLVAYEGERLYFRGIVGGYRLISEGGWSVGPVVQPRFDGYEEDDSSALDGMEDREFSVDAGLGVSLLTEVGLFGLNVVTDLLGRHDGQEIEFSYTIMFPVAEFDIIPSVGLRWQSNDLVDYYYGVRGDEVAFNRRAYEGDDALNPYVRVAARRKLGGRWNALVALQYEWLDNEIENSPIVDDDYDASILFGALYSW